ncbi:hypothetical protein L1889_10685 [Paenalcaligenes niemegkensis]|uniref:hypothetical protein n=1 Tax=Paenalcaligenes niemegkensis TaxID=2895469 RepID=UPI001EE8015B|nr:hypothetical protein [Paenalcaligenes niemegkensis]MCQ9617106.1 hypothetical protein [Paenalcaligenes niemegkensis]
MKIFNLFLRRAGVQPAMVRPSTVSVSRLSVICPRNDMAAVRKRIYTGFEAAGLRVTNLSVDHTDSHETAKACVTISCPPEMRSVLMTQARQVRDYPEVLNVQWERRQRNALN